MMESHDLGAKKIPFWVDDYVRARPDFHSRIMKYGYSVNHFLDISQLEADAARTPFRPSRAEFEALTIGRSDEQTEALAEEIWKAHRNSDPKGISRKSAEVLAQIDRDPIDALRSLNLALQHYSVEPGGESFPDFEIPVFRIVNASRYEKEINRIDFDTDSGSIVQLKGVLLYLSDPVQFEYVSRAYYCVKCETHSVSKFALDKCKICDSKDIYLDDEHEDTKTRNFQEAVIQENVEDLSGSPASINIRLFGSDINRWVVGDRITIVGTVGSRKIERKSSRKYEVDCLSSVETESSITVVSEEDLKQIKAMSSDPRILDKLSSMFVPEIIGHEQVKKGILLQAVGGIPREHSSFSVRGRIHILLAGDPGKAKSQFLIAHRSIHEKSLYISDTSKAGITAAVSDVGGKKAMIPGILVLANGGVACVDELDKMQKEDREGMHTAMEQGTISKSKAGLRAIFKAETSVLAAANPVNGRFDLGKDIPEQLKIEPTLLDRFDLIFWFVDSDTEDRKKDVQLALKILRPTSSGDPTFLKKFLKVAAANRPEITPESEEIIANKWAEIRDRSANKSSVGIRHLQAIVRLAEASAKIRFAEYVEPVDVETAVGIMSYSWEPIGYDLDRLVGFGKSMTDAIRFVTNSLKGKDSGVTYDELITLASMIGLDTETVKEAIQKAKQSGQIFEPRPNRYRVIA